MNNLKKVLIACFLCKIFAFSQNYTDFDKDFFSLLFFLPEIQQSQLDYKISLLENKSVERLFVPYASFSTDFNSGEKNFSTFSGVNSNSCAKIFQYLPGGLLFQTEISVPSYFSKDFNSFSIELNPLFLLEVPLCFSKIFISEFDSFFKNSFSIAQNYAKNSLNIAQRIAMKDFFYQMALFLFYKQKCLVLEEKLLLTENLCHDYEELLKMGKISLVNYMQVSEQYFSINKELSEAKLLLVQNETLLKSKKIDLSEWKEHFSLLDFILFWEENIEYLFASEFFSYEKELLLLKKNYSSLIKSVRNEMPTISLSSSFSCRPVANDFFFDNFSWNASISFNINVFPVVPYFDSKKKLVMAKKSYELSKETIEKIRFNKLKERNSMIKNSLAYCENMKNAFKTEQERKKMIEALFSMGRLSKMDVDFQKNAENLAELYYLKAKIDHLNMISSFY